MATARDVGWWLSLGGGAAQKLGAAVSLASAPAGLALTIAGGFALVAGDVLQGPAAPVVRAEDPGELLAEMAARVSARQKARAK